MTVAELREALSKLPNDADDMEVLGVAYGRGDEPYQCEIASLKVMPIEEYSKKLWCGDPFLSADSNQDSVVYMDMQ